jgi:hypothetical protein
LKAAQAVKAAAAHCRPLNAITDPSFETLCRPSRRGRADHILSAHAGIGRDRSAPTSATLCASGDLPEQWTRFLAVNATAPDDGASGCAAHAAVQAGASSP